MSDYLGNLLARTFSPATAVRPHIPSVFESPTSNSEFIAPIDLQTETLAGRATVTSPRTEIVSTPPAFSGGRPTVAPETTARAAGDHSLTNTPPTQALNASIEQAQPSIKPGSASVPAGQNQNPLPDRSPLLTHEVLWLAGTPKPTEKSKHSPARLRQLARTIPAEPKHEIRDNLSLSPSPNPTASHEPIPVTTPAELTAASRQVHPTPSSFASSAELDARVLNPTSVTSFPAVSHLSFAPRLSALAAHLRRERLEESAVRPFAPAVRVTSPVPLPKEDAPASTINVTIGRVEVRAVPPAAQPPLPKAKATPPLKLDDYLRQRSGGGRQ